MEKKGLMSCLSMRNVAGACFGALFPVLLLLAGTSYLMNRTERVFSSNKDSYLTIVVEETGLG